MTVLTADEALLARLRGVYEPVEIRDPSGAPVVMKSAERLRMRLPMLFVLGGRKLAAAAVLWTREYQTDLLLTPRSSQVTSISY